MDLIDHAINGFLKAMEAVNDRPDHFHHFTFYEAHHCRSLEATLNVHLHDYVGHHQCEKYEERLQQVLKTWFFDKEDELQRRGKLGDRSEDSRIEVFLGILFSLVGKPVVVYEVDSDWGKLYNYSTHFAFVTDQNVYILEMGITD